MTEALQDTMRPEMLQGITTYRAVQVVSPGKWELTLSKETVGGRYTLIMKRMDDDWRIIHDHTSG